MKKTPSPAGLRIVHQARTERARTYHLACLEQRITVDVAAVSGGMTGEEGWRVVARGKETPTGDEVTVESIGATPTDALRALARSWREDQRCYPSFDWETIESSLREVRGL